MTTQFLNLNLQNYGRESSLKSLKRDPDPDEPKSGFFWSKTCDLNELKMTLIFKIDRLWATKRVSNH